MSGKLDQPLDEIISTQRRASGRRSARIQRRASGRPANPAPVGGVQKTAKQPRGAAAKQAPAKAIATSGESKVVVSNLPKDVNEAQIKEYFVTSVGPIKKVELSYGPNSVSRGIATVIFHKPDGAHKAFNALNGLLVDNRPIKIEIVVSAAKAREIAPPAKTLTERISQPKSQPKSAAANNKKKEAAAKETGPGGARGGRKGRGGRAARSARPAKKSAEELDSEMADYWGTGNPGENANGAAPAAAAAAPAPANGDAPMDDEIL